MTLKSLFVIAILTIISFVANAQYANLIGASEKQIKQQIAGYDTVKKQRITDHEFYDLLVFQNNEKASITRFFFFPGVDRCHQITTVVPISFLKAYRSIADRRFIKVGMDRWQNRDSTVSISITKTSEKLAMSYSQL